jgi:hypothetical protein
MILLIVFTGVKEEGPVCPGFLCPDVGSTAAFLEFSHASVAQILESSHGLPGDASP